MFKRKFWQDLIYTYWKQKNIIWLSGVRRSGKTMLCQSLDDVTYFDCELPSVRSKLEDPESFLELNQSKRIILDEIHRLKHPSELLKIASDYHPKTQIIATGSSTLEASRRFSDTLTGRKKNIRLTPLLVSDLMDFGNIDLQYRLVRGGLPPFFLNKTIIESDFQDWLDSFWAKDIQELFRIQQKSPFHRFIELLFLYSGGIFEATRYTASCEVSRTTIMNYLAILEVTHIVNIIRPFSSRKSNEIISAPKVYTFDTGFVAYFKGFEHIRDEDLGILWEHFVLNEISGRFQLKDICYWRDKAGHEIDFIFIGKGKAPTVIECKWKDRWFDPKNMKIFRDHYPEGENIVVSSDIKEPYIKKIGNLSIKFTNISELSL